MKEKTDRNIEITIKRLAGTKWRELATEYAISKNALSDIVDRFRGRVTEQMVQDYLKGKVDAQKIDSATN